MPDIFSTKPKTEIKKETHEEPEKLHPKPQPEAEAVASVDKLIHEQHQAMSLFATYAKHPKGITFANQEPDEVILLFLRRHFITNVPWLITVFLLFLIPPLLLFFLSFLNSFTFPGTLVTVLISFYYLIIIGYAFSKFISWFYNIGVVTQKRIIDLDSANILAHNTATANFNEIVDVKFTQRGFFQSSFDYGDIHIQTEAIHANFEFDACPKPTEVTDVISDLRVTMKGHPHGNS